MCGCSHIGHWMAVSHCIINVVLPISPYIFINCAFMVISIDFTH